MTRPTKDISRNAKWGMAQTLVSAISLFFLYKFLLTTLGEEKLGLWSLILATTSLAKIGELGFATATLRFVGKHKGTGNLKSAAELLETSIISICAPLLVLITIAIPISFQILDWLLPANQKSEANEIIPWALLSLWLSITSGLVQSAIDGCGRMDRRNMILIVTNLIYIASVILLIKPYGLKGVAIAQTLQAGLTLLLMWLAVHKELPSLRLLPLTWKKSHFLEISSFAVNLQIGSVAGMFIEPITKAFISTHVGLGFLGYYEMANQVVTRIRAVLVAGFQAIVPQIAASTDPKDHLVLFTQSRQKILDIGVPFIAITTIFFPTLSHIWIGHHESDFIVAGFVLSITWLMNSILMPAYFYLVGTGKGRPIAIAHVSTLIGTGLLMFLSSYFQNTLLLVISPAVALIGSNIYLHLYAQNDLEKSTPHAIETIRRKSKFFTTGVSLLAVAAFISINYTVQTIFQSIVLFCIFSTIIGAASLATYFKSTKS